MRWDSLLDPVRKAVHDLLMRVAGAEAARRAGASPEPGHRRQELGNCFLVYGGRGTGKTTVLLSAQEAVRASGANPGFFDRAPDRGPDPDDTLGPATQACAQALHADRHIVWLDPLDLEPLPRTTNLLTTLLTRVRNALDAGDDPQHPARDRLRSSSIFEESGDDARALLDRLINDATLMWEEIQEPDTRNKAQRQRAAADIYASFRPSFARAMDALSRRLDLRHGHDQGCAILLPIDNIDRSTEHLKSIVKLAQMVSHPCLWLVMAGDRVEVETFLERAYWTELIVSHEGVDARGKAGESGEDETLGMARRQGHATAQKVWPPSHRIEVDHVKPAQTLDFRPPGVDESRSLRALLSRVPVRCSMRQAVFGPPLPYLADQADRSDPHHAFMLIRLFETTASGATPAPRRGLTRLGEHALRLPARSVLDLWQLADWVAAHRDRPLGAVKIARTMLRCSAAGSALPNRMGQHLQNEIITRDPDGGTLLNFDPVRLRVRGRLSIATSVGVIEDPTRAGDVTVRSTLRARRSQDMRVDLSLEGPDGAVKLPELAAAWLAILYDILIYEPTLAVLGMASIDVPLVLASHDLVLPGDTAQRRRRLDAPWRAPNFSTFHAHDVFWRRWEACLQASVPACHADGASSARLSPTQLALGWVQAALQTFIDTSPYPASVADGLPTGAGPEAVLDRAAMLYQRYQPETIQPLAQRQTFDSAELCRWLENALPMLFSQVYAPGGTQTDCHRQLRAWLAAHAEHALVAHWRKSRAFLLADLALKLDDMAPFEPPPQPGGQATAAPVLPALAPDTRRALEAWAQGGLADALG
jgi:hypothetical protein